MAQQEILPTIEEMQTAEWNFIRRERDSRIAAVAFEYERYNREKRLTLATTRTDAWMAELDQYVQKLADLPQATESPLEIVWPVKPE